MSGDLNIQPGLKTTWVSGYAKLKKTLSSRDVYSPVRGKREIPIQMNYSGNYRFGVRR